MAITDKKTHWLNVLFRDEVRFIGNKGLIVPSGSTLERPTGENGYLRYNTTDGRLESYEGGAWGPVGGAASGAAFFTDLGDTPNSYAGLGNQLLRVNGAETGVQFIDGETLFVPLGGTTSPMTGNLVFTGGARITGLPVTPVTGTEAVSKAYVDSISAGLDPKESCRAGTTASMLSYSPSGGSSGTGAFSNVDMTGPLTDGVAMNPGDRLLVKDQVDARQNGIYVVLTNGANGSLERAPDQDGTPANEVSGGNYTFIETGGTQAGTGWTVVFDGIIILNTHNITWSLFSGSGSASLASLTDTIITAPGAGDYFQYNGAAWVNVDYIPRIQNASNNAYVDTDAIAGQIDIQAFDNAGGPGGAVNISAGDSGTTGLGGNVTITSGAGFNNDSGVITIQGANAVNTGIGGDVTITAGNAAANRRGGTIMVTAGNTAGTGVNGGGLSFTSGNSTGSGSGGAIAFTGGTGAGAGVGASISFQPGSGPINGTLQLLPIDASTASEFRMYEGTGGGADYVGFKAPDSITGGSVVWTLPDGDGGPGQVLSTNGGGALSWTTVSVATPTRIEDSDTDSFVDTDFGGGDSDYVVIQSGTPGPNTNGGKMDINTGNGGATSGHGGDLDITTGDAVTSGRGGDIQVFTGVGAGTANRGGRVRFNVGDGAPGLSAAAGDGGAFAVDAGNGGASPVGNGGAGGILNLESGNGGQATAGTGNGGAGGDIFLNAGNGATSVGGTHGSGGNISIRAGNSNGTGTAGTLSLTSGYGGTLGGNAAPITLQGGLALSGNSQGGEVQIYAGSGTGNAFGADVKIYAGAASSAGGDYVGGDLVLRAGNSAGTNANGGNVTVFPGQGLGTGRAGALKIEGGKAGEGGEVHLVESGGSDYVGFKAPAAVPAPQVWELPATDGAAGQQLATNGSGTLQFIDRVYDVGSSVIGAPMPAGILWRFSVVRPFLLHPSAASASIAVAAADPASLATAPASIELHLVAVGVAAVPGIGSPTNIGEIVFPPATAAGIISTWPLGGGPLPPPGLPVSIPPGSELILLYPTPDATLGNISFTYDGVL